MSEASQSRRRILPLIVLVIMLVGSFIILRPRLWVKNKTAELTVDGRLSEDVKLFHGSDDRLLFYLDGADPGKAFIYVAEDPNGASGLWRCDQIFFARLKVIALSKLRVSGCNEAKIGEYIQPVNLQKQSLGFSLHSVPIVVSWQPAPQ